MKTSTANTRAKVAVGAAGEKLGMRVCARVLPCGMVPADIVSHMRSSASLGREASDVVEDER
jgi:hypothetical protein